MKFLFNCILISFLFSFFLISCKKDSFIRSSDAYLNITRDSIKFDTVFTTAGSVTQSFKIINENDQKILLSKVKLSGGAASAFKININGNSTIEEDNIEVAANDSIYVFVSVYVDPTTAILPFILQDSILINYNGNNRFVQLEAYGQNAHFIDNALLTGNNIWSNDLPYVILGAVRVDTTASLTIEAGCKIFAHANAPFLVDGTLIINGEKNNEVIFRGDRLDTDYKDLPASWPGIYFRGTSKDNVLTFAVIKNANDAIVVQELSINSNPKLIMHQCIIDNAFEAGLYAINGSVQADNILITNCGNNIVLQLGGEYNFTNCSIAGYSNQYLLHTNPVLQVSDATINNGAITTADLNASFVNCIFWGDAGVDDEVAVDKEGSGIFNLLLENCIYKALNDPANTTLNSSISNLDPSFDSIDVANKYYDFRITKNPGAPGINTGINIPFSSDLDDKPRAVGLPDIGSYEKQP